MFEEGDLLWKQSSMQLDMKFQRCGALGEKVLSVARRQLFRPIQISTRRTLYNNTVMAILTNIV